MKRISASVSAILACLLLAVSCVEWEKPGDRSNFIISTDGSPVELEWEEHGGELFGWYSCDADGSNQIFLEYGKSYTTEAFTSPELRHYICKAFDREMNTAYSHVFHVAHTGLSTVCINTLDGNEITSKKDYVQATISIAKGTTDSVFHDTVELGTTAVSIKGRGASSWASMPNKSYNLKFDSKVSLLDGISKDKRWCLTANYRDRSELANWVASYLGNELFDSYWNPSFEPVDVFVNGEYRGMYLLGETIKIGKNRVDVPDLTELSSASSIDDGGYILEITSESGVSSFSTLHGVSMTFKDPDLVELPDGFPWTRSQVIEHVRQKVNRLEMAIMGESDEDLSDLMDIDSMVDWFIVNDFLINSEARFQTSCYLYYDPDDGLFHMGPNWDFDRSYLNRPHHRSFVTSSQNKWFSALVENSVFVEALKQRWSEAVGDGSLDQAIEDILSMEERVDVARRMDSLRWDTEATPVSYARSWLNTRKQWFTDFINSL